ncbi:hypothetical protein OSTOST_09940, partial [Ostertagia ostertagi]
YEFKKEGQKAALLELGPRFTLRLKWLQKGTFDTRWGENRFAWGEDALGPHVPVGGKMGAPENPELHTYDGEYRGTPSKGDVLIPDWSYRSATKTTTYIDRCVTKFISALLWELGILPDSAEDPEYWGNHGKKYGTYR